MARPNEKTDATTSESSVDEKQSSRQSMASTNYTFDHTTLFSDDATVRADDQTSAFQRDRSESSTGYSMSTRFSTATTAIPSAFALSRTSSPTSVIKSNHSSVMGTVTGFAIFQTGRFLRFLGLKSEHIRQYNIFRHWIRELNGLLNAPPEQLLKSKDKLAHVLDDLLTLITSISESKGKTSEKDLQTIHSLVSRTVDTEWLNEIRRYSFKSGQQDCLVVIIEYLCRLYRTQHDPIILQKTLRGIVECGSSLFSISASFAPEFFRSLALPVITDAVSQNPELFIITEESSLHRDSILLTLSFVLRGCNLTSVVATTCGEDRLSRLLETVSGEEYCTLSKEFVIVSSFADFARYSPTIRKRLPSLATVSMLVHILQISTLQVYGKSVSWNTLLDIEELQDKICEAATLLLRTLFKPADYLWSVDDLFLGNVTRLIMHEKFKQKFIASGAVASALASLEVLQGHSIPLDAPTQPKRAIASLLMLIYRLDPVSMQTVADAWLSGRSVQAGQAAEAFDPAIFCWATALFSVSVEFYPELAVYPDNHKALQRLVCGRRETPSRVDMETYTLALEQCWESVYGKPILKAMGLSEYDILFNEKELTEVKKLTCYTPPTE